MNTVVDTAAIQSMDSAHFLHPFTDFKDLNSKGARVIARAKDIYVWDSEGNRMLDAMSGLWCVNVGYGRQELADAASKQMMELPFYNNWHLWPPRLVIALLTMSFTRLVAAKAMTPMCVWCVATGICWANQSAKSSLAVKMVTTVALWQVPL